MMKEITTMLIIFTKETRILNSNIKDVIVSNIFPTILLYFLILKIEFIK